MDASTTENLKKGYYHHREEGVTLIVKQYIVTENEGKRNLLLRLINTSDIVVEGFSFDLLQLSTEGEIIAKTTIRYDNIRILPGDDYRLPRAILLKGRCHDFRIHTDYVVSGAFRYHFRNGRAVAHYDRRGYQSPKRRHPLLAATVKRRFAKAGRLYRFLVFLGVLSFLAAVGLSLLYGTATIRTVTPYEGGTVYTAAPHPSTEHRRSLC